MIVRSIIIRRDGDFGYGAPNLSKPLRAVIEVHGQNGKVELNLSEDLSSRVVSLIAEEVAAAGRATAEAMTAEVFTATALPEPANPAPL